jgi:hypothetical protein
MHIGTPTHKFRQHLRNNTDFRWIFKAFGDILWPYKVVKTKQGGRIIESGTPTLEKYWNLHIRGRLIYGPIKKLKVLWIFIPMTLTLTSGTYLESRSVCVSSFVRLQPTAQDILKVVWIYTWWSLTFHQFDAQWHTRINLHKHTKFGDNHSISMVKNYTFCKFVTFGPLRSTWLPYTYQKLVH